MFKVGDMVYFNGQAADWYKVQSYMHPWQKIPIGVYKIDKLCGNTGYYLKSQKYMVFYDNQLSLTNKHKLRKKI